jgi:hypothetical protein
MIAGMVRTRKSLSLRVAASVAGIDIEFGRTSSDGKFQRIDVLSSEFGARDLLRRYGVIVAPAIAGEEFREGDSKLLSRPKLESSKVTD